MRTFRFTALSPALICGVLAFGSPLPAALPVLPSLPDEVGVLSFWPKVVPTPALNVQLPLTVRIAFNLTSADTATIHLEADVTGAERFEAIAETEVKRGRGNADVRGAVTPPPEGFTHPIKVRARLDLPNGNLVSNTRTIFLGEIRPDQTDSLLIKGCQPETLIIGQRQEVGILIAYRLVSADRGEINVGFNELAPQGHVVSATKLVERGEGEIVITAWVTPRAWGDNILFQASAGLVEVPHAHEWSPLATDSEPLELKSP